MNKFRIIVASDIERDIIATEIWYNNELWGEIISENGKFSLIQYPQDSIEPWSFNLDDLILTLLEGKQRAEKIDG